jgi:hypothetical protein
VPGRDIACEKHGRLLYERTLQQIQAKGGSMWSIWTCASWIFPQAVELAGTIRQPAA